MITGITTAVLKGANAPGRSNGVQVGADPDELVTEGDPGCESGAIGYDRYVPDGQAVTHAEPADLATSPLDAPRASQHADSAHANVTPAYPTPGTGRGAGRDANGTRAR